MVTTSQQGAPHCHYWWVISIHFSSQCLPWCGADIVIGVCLSQDLPRGGWTSAASEVLSHEITDLIKSSPSPSPFSTSCLSMWLPLCLPLSSTPSLYSFLYITSIFLLDFLFSLSHHPTPLSSPPLPLGHKEPIQPPVPESYLNFSYVSQPAAELYQSSRDPVTLGARDARYTVV